jgi:general secretion pathway protein G
MKILRSNLYYKGFTILELLLIIAIVATLALIAIPMYADRIEKARIARATVDIRTMGTEISAYEVGKKTYPDSIADYRITVPLDPWGNPYQYTKTAGAIIGQLRKDRFLVPLNTDFDLYSMGKDGQSRMPLTARASWDDIIRANNGAYVGLASEY